MGEGWIDRQGGGGGRGVMRKMQMRSVLRKVCVRRLKSTKATGSASSAAPAAVKLDPDSIVRHFDVSFARSSGAGGQHVNTTDSKAVVRLPVARWYASRGRWIPATGFDTIMANLHDPTAPPTKRFPYFSPSGDVVISSSTTRYRDKNLGECLRKFVDAVAACSRPREEVSEEKRQRWDRLKKLDNEDRIRDKKHRKDKKGLRRKISLDM